MRRCPSGAALLLATVGFAYGAGEAVPTAGPPVAELAPFNELLTTLVRDQQVGGAAIAISKDGRLIFSRSYGWADPDAREKLVPTALFRIASLSKPITAAAILVLVDRGKLSLDDKAFPLLGLKPLPGKRPDPRLKEITIRHLLHHTAGFDRDQSFDPMFRPVDIAREVGVAPPAGPTHIIRYMLGRPLDFDPGSRFAYSNFGYCVLGRIIEKVSGQSYENFVRDNVCKPLGMAATRLGKTLQRAPGEVKYRDPKTRLAQAVVGPNFGKPVPAPYGAWYLEAMDAHGGWLSSAVDLVKFACAFDDPDKCPILKPQTIAAMLARPEGSPGLDKDGNPAEVYYGLGWNVRPQQRGYNTWHLGAFDGTAALLVRRFDGINWAVLFNARTNAEGQHLGELVDPLLHQAAAKVLQWPTDGR
ncbi:MAG: beta-lactamase family protein [Gemmataceae bacterium]|nr:beta-lactamase family protein [Gemmataceae bacterium]